MIDGVEKRIDVGPDDKIVIFNNVFDAIDCFERGFVFLISVISVTKSQMRRKLVDQDALDDFGFLIRYGYGAKVAIVFRKQKRCVRSEIEKCIWVYRDFVFMGFISYAFRSEDLLERFIKNREFHA